MCGRYFIDESAELKTIVNEMKTSVLMKFWENSSQVVTEGEIRPTDIVPVIALNRRGESSVFPMKWGFAGKTLLINARVETASEKPSFRNEWLSHRCVIPAAYYFEWSHMTGKDGKVHTVDKYIIQPQESGMTWICGLYRFENNLPVFVILTREPGDEVRKIHNRMPLIIAKDMIDEWIRPDADPNIVIERALTDMVLEKQSEVKNV
ncbi:Putative SOS response-associated peptidase YedK [Eubacterium ruminantium]|nr:Putative SOS response-associated peptidase YedK [Eubacterium ruminantium]